MTSPRGLGVALASLTSILLVVAWLAVTLRVAVRKSIKAYWLDDTFMVIGLVLFTVAGVFGVLGAFNGLRAPKERLPEYNRQMGRMCFFFFQIFYVACTAPIKKSISIALLRINGNNKRNKYILYGVIALATISMTVTFVGVMMQAKPPSAYWTGKGTVTDSSYILYFSYAFSAVSIATDLTLSVMPIVILRNVQMPRDTKIPLVVVLCLAFLASVATIARLRPLLAYTHDNNLSGLAGIATCSLIEAGLGIIGGSLPALRPLLKRFHGPKNPSPAHPLPVPYEDREQVPLRALPRRVTTGITKILTGTTTPEELVDISELVRAAQADRSTVEARPDLER